MPRIKQYADKYAMQDLANECLAQASRYGYRTNEQIGGAIGITHPTVRKYLDDPGQIRLGMLRRMVLTLRLDPVVLLRALGYETKEIRRMALKIAATENTASGGANAQTPGRREAI